MVPARGPAGAPGGGDGEGPGLAGGDRRRPSEDAPGKPGVGGASRGARGDRGGRGSASRGAGVPSGAREERRRHRRPGGLPEELRRLPPVGDEGREVGPNLASIRTKAPEEILDQILDPNRLVDPQYVSYQVLTTGGRVVDGILDAANPTSVTLRRAEGATETVLRANIEKIVCTGVSLMPEGLEKVIAPEQMSDLIAFLRSP